MNNIEEKRKIIGENEALNAKFYFKLIFWLNFITLPQFKGFHRSKIPFIVRPD